MYLEIFEENTLFSRVGVIYPDNSMLTQKQTGRSVEDGVFEELLKEADCRMYEVKERYYQMHERRRK